MFSGIVEALGRVRSVDDDGETRTLGIETPSSFLGGVQTGSSIAVDGACLTAVAVQADGFTAEVVGTTLSRTIAGGYREGTVVNLEKALEMGGRLDGHIVQGHIDGVGHIIHIRDVDGVRLLEASVPSEVHDLTLLHGSIALNGVSLTVNRLEGGNRVEVALIPHTWDATNLSGLTPGDPVNVEGDLIGKYVGKLLRRSE